MVTCTTPPFRAAVRLNSGVRSRMKDEKARRMEIRRDIGNRPPPIAPVRSRGAQYLIAHACFTCRKSFKIVPRDERQGVCPSCSGPIFEMGRSFKAPAKRDLEQWAKVRALYVAGFRFFSYRSSDCPPLPDKLSEVDSFIRENPRHPLRITGSGT